MPINGNEIGAGLGEWETALDGGFVDRVHLAMKTPHRYPGGSDGTYFTHAGKQYFRGRNGNVFKRVDGVHGGD